MRKLLILLFIFVLTGCSTETESAKGTVYTTVAPLADLSKAILGEDYKVESVYPKDSDPHHYELTAQDMTNVANSDLFVYISDSNNSFTHDLKESGDYATEFFNLTSSSSFVEQVDPNLYNGELIISEEEHEEDEEDAHNHEVIDGEIIDPHVWVSPNKLLIIGDVLVDEYSEHFSEDAELFTSNWEAYSAKLSSLDQAYSNFANEQKYPIIVSHSAYNYLDYDYGIESVSLYGLVNEDEPTTKEIETVIKQINDSKIPAIYVEQNDLENRVIKQIAAETGVEVLTLNNMSTTSVDTLTALQDNIDALQILK